MTTPIRPGETRPSLRRLYGVVYLDDGVTRAVAADASPPAGSLQVSLNGSSPVDAGGPFVGDGSGEYYYELSPTEVESEGFVAFKFDRPGHQLAWFVGQVGEMWVAGDSTPERLRQPILIFDDSDPPSPSSATVTSPSQLQTARSSVSFVDAAGTLHFVASGLHYYQGTAGDSSVESTLLIRFSKSGFRDSLVWTDVTAAPSSTPSAGEETTWSSIEVAIRQAVVTGTGIDSSRVIWDYYSQAPRPAPPFVELSLSDLYMQGEDWVVYDDAPDPSPGAEVRVRVRGHRSVSLTLQAFGAFGVGSTAFRVLSRFISSLALLYTDLDDAGVGVGDVGAVQSVEGRKGGVLEPRARCKLELYVASELESRTTFIERVQLQISAGPLSKTLWIPGPP